MELLKINQKLTIEGLISLGGLDMDISRQCKIL